MYLRLVCVLIWNLDLAKVEIHAHCKNGKLTKKAGKQKKIGQGNETNKIEDGFWAECWTAYIF